jgi:putative ABC transport system substrate-binding protein
MKRREFMTLVGSAAAAWPLVARAQQPTMPVIGFLGVGTPEAFADRVQAFRQGVREVGFVDGRDVAIEYHGLHGQNGPMPVLAAELVRRSVAVIATGGIPPVLAAQAATKTIPIVFNVGVDPVELKLVASLNRPGGNLTGVSNLNVELGSKQLELLREVVPSATTVGLLVNRTSPTFADILTKHVQAAAQILGLQVLVLAVSTERDFDAVFASLVQARVGALVIASDPFFNSRSEKLAALALSYQLPTIHQFREFPSLGGLMSYGANIRDSYRLMGVYAGRILKGDKPVDLPVDRSTKVELIINLKTAKALGVTFPLSLLGRADEVIE